MAHKALVHSIQIHPTELQQPAPPKRGLLSFMRLPVPAGDRARSEKFLDLAFSPDSRVGADMTASRKTVPINPTQQCRPVSDDIAGLEVGKPQ
jgi:hypothetical protein